MARVVVVGSFVQDLSFSCESFPQPGQTVVGQFSPGPGGKGANQAVAAARAGASATFMGAVGADFFGDGAQAFLAAEGIDCRLARKEEHPTGAGAILVDATGQNQIVVSLGANAFLSPWDLVSDAFLGSAVVVTQFEVNIEATAHALRLGRAAGALTILNPAPMLPDFNRGILNDVSVLIPNETEFAALMGLKSDDLSPGPSLHDLCRQIGVPTVIVTLGDRGCFISQANGFSHLPVGEGIRAIDSTGAGDAFVGAFAAAAAEWGAGEIERAARFANAAAGISVMRKGTGPAMAHRAESWPGRNRSPQFTAAARSVMVGP